MADLVGKKLGRYTVTALIGQGGMATVYRAHDPVLDREVAIKIMHGHLAADPAFVGRFQHEAQAVAALSHPNIVKVFDFGTEVDSYYMVMELIDGSTLANLLTERAAAASPGRGAALSSKEILRIFPPLCSAVDYAGARGMVHRDIKPANVLLTAQGDPVLTDYGIAKLMGATSYTVAGMVMGSAHYMSPEQVQGFPTDVRSDIYSLGVCLFEALAGKVPYDAETTASILAQHLSAPIPPAQRLNPNLPADIQAVVDKVLAKEPENRFQKATALATALQTILSLPGTSTTGTRPVQNLAATVIVQGAPQGARAYTPTGIPIPTPTPTGIPRPTPTGTPVVTAPTRIDSGPQPIHVPVGATRLEQVALAPESPSPYASLGAQSSARRRKKKPWPLIIGAAVVGVALVVAVILLTGGGDKGGEATVTTLPGGIPTGATMVVPTTAMLPQIAQLINEGDSLVRNGQLDEAIDKYNEALKTSPDSDLARTQLGIAYYLHRGFPRDMAPQQLQIATTANPLNGTALDFLGLSLLAVVTEYQTGDLATAEQACRGALKINMRDAQAHAFLARILATDGRLDEAQPEIQTALDLAPKDPWVLASAGWVRSLQSQWTEAATFYQQAIATRPKWAAFLHLYAEALRESGQSQQAMGIYANELLLGQGYEAAAHEGMGVTLWKLGDLAGAVTNLEASLALDATGHYAHWALGAVLDEQGLYDAALPHLQAATMAAPNSAGYQEWLGDCLFNLGRYPEARGAVDKALQIDPNRSGAQSIAAQLQQKGF